MLILTILPLVIEIQVVLIIISKLSHDMHGIFVFQEYNDSHESEVQLKGTNKLVINPYRVDK